MARPSSRWTEAAPAVITITFAAIGQLCMRRGMLQAGALDSWNAVRALLTGLVRYQSGALWALTGIAIYAIGMFTWLQVLARTELSRAFPLLGLTYVLVYLGAIAWPMLEEPATPLRSVGTLVIVAGVSLVARSGARG